MALRPLDASEAYSVIEAMVAERTSKAAQRRLLKLALGPCGNLDDDAKAVYRARLQQLSDD